MSILDNIKKSLTQKHIQVGVLVFLVVLLSFGVGFVLGRNGQNPSIVIEKAEN